MARARILAQGKRRLWTVYVVLEAERTCFVVIVGPHENIYDRAERRVAALRRAGRL